MQITSFFAYITAWIGFLASVIGILVFFRESLIGQDTAIQYLVIFLVFMMGVIFLENLYLRYYRIKNRRYGHTIKILNRGFNTLHRLQSKDSSDVVEFKECLRNLCDCVSESFKLLTGSNCVTTIKILRQDNQGLYCETLVRNRHARERFEIDRKLKQKNIKHYLEDNSAFQWALLGENNRQAWFSNNLLGKKLYKNTSAKAQLKPNGVDILNTHSLIRRWTYWPLPYRSGIVVAIKNLNLLVEDNPGDPNPKVEPGKEFIGFLCVDSQRLFIFSRKFDVDVLVGVADGLFNVINNYLNELSKPASGNITKGN